MALGIQLLIGGALLLFFGLEKSLTTLNDELLVLPGGLSRIMGITTHLGIPVELPEWILYTASVIIVGSFVLFLFNRRVRHVPGKFL
jgi:divalent metal cation (Fe/Co/Zn/Cd) transporter